MNREERSNLKETLNFAERSQALLMLVGRLLDEKRIDVLQRLLGGLFGPDLAALLSELDRERALQVFRLLSAEKAGEVLEELEDTDLASAFLESSNRETIRDVLDNMSDNDLAGMLRVMDAAKADRFLNALLAEDADALRELIRRSSGTAGALMTTAFIALPEHLDVTESLRQIREQAEESETINYLYIVNAAGQLAGVLSLRELLFAPRTLPLAELMTLNPLTLQPGDSQEEAAHLIQRYGLQALPIVDDNLVMQGIVTFDDALDVLEEEGGADLYRMVGIPTRTDDSEDLLLRLSPLKAAVRRLPWLVLCLFGDMVTGGVIKSFEDALAQIVALAFFIPVLMGSAGNIGTQSLAIAVRGIAGGKLQFSVFLKQLWREGQAGIMLGMICGAVIGVVAAVWQGSPQMGLAIGVTMWCGLTVSTLIGMTVPLLIHKINLDPALASGPVITTLADMFAILVYFNLASILLGIVT